MSGITTAQSGFPMSIGSGGNAATVFGGNQHADLTGEPFKSGQLRRHQWRSRDSRGNEVLLLQPGGFFGARRIHIRQRSSLLLQSEGTRIREPGFDVRKVVQLSTRDSACRSRSQMFNAFNHANFGIPNASVGSPNMGLSSSTQGARQMQGVLKITY